MARAHRVYLVGPTTGSPEERAALFGPSIEAVRRQGYEVLAPFLDAPARPALAERLAHADTCLALLKEEADCVAVLPGAEGAWEVPVVTTALGAPLLTLDDLFRDAVA